MIVYYLLVSILPLTLHPFWTMFVGELTMVKYIGLASVIVAVLHLLRSGQRPRLFQAPQSRAFLLLLLIVSLSYFSRGLPFTWEHSPLISFVSFFMFNFVTVCLVDTIDRLRWTLLVAIGSLAWATLYVIREFHKFGGRPGWVLGDPNYYTISCLVVLPLAYVLFRQEPEGWVRKSCLGSLVLIMVGITLAASRGGLIGLTIAVLYLVVRSERRLRDSVVFLAILAAIMFLAPDSPVRRLFNPNVHDDHSREVREILWAAGWTIIQQNPITGIGLGNYKYVVGRYQDLDRPWENVAHNTYIELAAETGVPGALAFMAVLALTLASLERTRRAAASGRHRFLVGVTTGMQAGILGYAANAVFISAQYQKLLWLMIGISTCLPALLREVQRKAAPRPAAAARLRTWHVAAH
jgi:O-antigen ligase